MIQSLRTIKNRIKSIENTRKVTGALELISIAKFRKMEKVLSAGRPYLARLESLTGRLSGAAEAFAHSLFEQRKGANMIALCVVASDSGLSGAYNNNVLRAAEKFMAGYGKEAVSLVTVGRKAFVYFRKRDYTVVESFIGLNARYAEEAGSKIRTALTDLFLARRVDAVYAAYTRFETGLVYKPVVERLLPLKLTAPSGAEDILLEPDASAILAELIPRYCAMKLRCVFLESFTSEHAARAVAMKKATDNARELLHGLILMRNKVRQARITQDIMEIISSAEALKS